MRTLRIAAFCMMVTAISPACKKDSKKDDPPVTPPANGTRLQLSLDSLYLYAKETYLWYDALPDYNTFNPRGYAGSDDLTSLKAELFKISQYKLNPTTQKPYEYTDAGNRPKFSFVETGNAAQGIKGAVDLEGQGNDYGLGLTIGTNGANRYVFVRLVEKGSAAALAGITRGCRITTMNGAPVSTDRNVLDNILATAATISLTLAKPLPDNTTTFSVNLTKGTYTNDPVYTYKVFPANGTNITGYINLARFSQLSNAQPGMDKAFQDFAAAGVNNLVIDLRYNGGGYVPTFQYLANLIAPASLTGSVMYKEIFNTLLQTDKAPILKSIPLLGADGKQRTQNGRLLTYADVNYTVDGNTFKFEKKGNLGTVKNVVFIVSGGTASASELTINSLKAYPEKMTVKLVGSATTYGKPVGFFGIGIDKFTVYMSQFSSVNAKGVGDYYAGFPVDISSIDDIQRDFGDPAEDGLAKALAFINTGAGGRTTSDRIMNINGRVMNANSMTFQNVGGEGFVGMVEERIRLK